MEKKYPVVTRVPEHIYKRLLQLSGATGISISALVRIAVLRFWSEKEDESIKIV